MQQTVQLQRGSRLAEQRRDHQRAVRQHNGNPPACGGQGLCRVFGGVGGFCGFCFGSIIGFAGDLNLGLCKIEGVAAPRTADRRILAADLGKVAVVHLRALRKGADSQRSRAVRCGKQERLVGAQLVHGIGDAQVAGRAQGLIAVHGLNREDAAALDCRRREADLPVGDCGAAERIGNCDGGVFRRQNMFKRLARAVRDGRGEGIYRAGKQGQRRRFQRQPGRGGRGFSRFIERRRVGNLAFAAVGGAVLHGRLAVRKGDKRGRAAAVEVDRVGAAERQERIGKRRERQPCGVTGASAVGDEEQIAAVRADAERRAGLPGLLMLLVHHAVDGLAVPQDDVAAADRRDRVGEIALAGDAHRDGLTDRKRGIIRRCRKRIRHGQDGASRGDLAVLDAFAHCGDLGAHLAAERDGVVEREDILGRGKAGQRRGLAVVAGEQVDTVDAGIFVEMADREGRVADPDRDRLTDLAEDRIAVLVKADGIAVVRRGEQPPVREQHAHRHAGVQAEKVGVDRCGQGLAVCGCHARQGRELFAAVQGRAEVDGSDPRAGCGRCGDGECGLHNLARCAVLIARERCRRAERSLGHARDAAEGAEPVRVDRRRRFGGRVRIGLRFGSGIGSGHFRGGGFRRGNGFGGGRKQQGQRKCERRQCRGNSFVCICHAGFLLLRFCGKAVYARLTRADTVFSGLKPRQTSFSSSAG